MTSSGSESETEIPATRHETEETDAPSERTMRQSHGGASTVILKGSTEKSLTDAEVSAAFTRFYMQRVTVEFADDLDRIRGAGDFQDTTLTTLIDALQQGTSIFSIEEQRRIVMAGRQ